MTALAFTAVIVGVYGWTLAAVHLAFTLAELHRRRTDARR